MDESPKQLIGETKTPIVAGPGKVAKYDYEYKRNGVCNVFMASEPSAVFVLVSQWTESGALVYR